MWKLQFCCHATVILVVSHNQSQPTSKKVSVNQPTVLALLLSRAQVPAKTGN